jgi:hypothetical protein
MLMARFCSALYACVADRYFGEQITDVFSEEDFRLYR